jgi:cytochrome c553
MSMRPASLLLALLLLPVAAVAATPAAQDYRDAVGRSPDAARGERLFVTCAGCHRANGRGNLDGSVPLIAGQHFNVVVKQLADYRHAGRWDPRMQHYADTHVLPDVQAIADVAAHVASLPRAGVSGTGDGNRLPLGRALFDERCASCHGRRGEGDAKTVVPRIDGQHQAYLLRQFREAVAGARPAFPLEHVRLLQGLEANQLDAVADAVARLKP